MKVLKTALLVVLILGAAGVLAAARRRADSAAEWKEVMAKAKISLVDAIQMAEKKTGGVAIEAEIEFEDGKVIMEVVVLEAGKRPKLVEVELNGETGAIIETEEVGDDDDDDEDDDDDNDDGEHEEDDD